MKWVLAIALIGIGTLGYIERLFEFKWRRNTIRILFCLFVLFSIAKLTWEQYEARKAPANFYS
jgi:hypothetical protein